MEDLAIDDTGDNQALDELQESGAIHAITADLVGAPAAVALPQDIATPARFPSVVRGTVSCRPGEREMVYAAYDDLNKVLSSDLFRTRLLAAQFTETQGMGNGEIYDLAVNRSPIEVDFAMFTGGFRQNHLWHTMGYEDPAHPTVCYANRHFIQRKEVCASLILHETMHIIGFRHDDVKATSVPYVMNRIYEAVAAELGLGS